MPNPKSSKAEELTAGHIVETLTGHRESRDLKLVKQYAQQEVDKARTLKDTLNDRLKESLAAATAELERLRKVNEQLRNTASAVYEHSVGRLFPKETHALYEALGAALDALPSMSASASRERPALTPEDVVHYIQRSLLPPFVKREDYRSESDKETDFQAAVAKVEEYGRERYYEERRKIWDAYERKLAERDGQLESIRSLYQQLRMRAEETRLFLNSFVLNEQTYGDLEAMKLHLKEALGAALQTGHMGRAGAQEAEGVDGERSVATDCGGDPRDRGDVSTTLTAEKVVELKAAAQSALDTWLYVHKGKYDIPGLSRHAGSIAAIRRALTKEVPAPAEGREVERERRVYEHAFATYSERWTIGPLLTPEAKREDDENIARECAKKGEDAVRRWRMTQSLRDPNEYKVEP